MVIMIFTEFRKIPQLTRQHMNFFTYQFVLFGDTLIVLAISSQQQSKWYGQSGV
jgi:hypothetical protein